MDKYGWIARSYRLQVGVFSQNARARVGPSTDSQSPNHLPLKCTGKRRTTPRGFLAGYRLRRIQPAGAATVLASADCRENAGQRARAAATPLRFSDRSRVNVGIPRKPRFGALLLSTWDPPDGIFAEKSIPCATAPALVFSRSVRRQITSSRKKW